MFILDEPFVSNFLKDTLDKNNYSVLKNRITDGFFNNYVTLQDVKRAHKIYTNSENSLGLILENSEFEPLKKQISLCKDKVEFRKLLGEIYPDFFYKKISFSELSSLNSKDFKYPFVIKPNVGFLSVGVYTVYHEEEFYKAIEKLKNSIEKSKGAFPDCVLNSKEFIIEEFIEGEEFAIDVYYDKNSKPVILNVYKHPFLDEYDVSDRLYITSYEIVNKNYERFYSVLEKIGKIAGFSEFPMHIELRANKNNVIPIEINPLRFAGWCLCDLANFAYGINVYEYFMENKIPNWDKKDDNLYAFVLGDVPNLENKNFEIDKEAFLNDLGAEILDARYHDYKTKPLFASVFIKAKNFEEIKHILKIDTKKYVREKIAF